MSADQHLGACREPRTREADICGKVLLLGEDNPLSIAPEHALYPYPEGCSGHRLCSKILGVHESTYLATWRTNLCVGTWSTTRARERARQLMHGTPPWNVIVLLGRKVAGAFEHVINDYAAFALPPFKSAVVPSCEGVPPMTLLSLPHPSGRNTLWNHFRNCESARMLLEQAAPGYPVGEAL